MAVQPVSSNGRLHLIVDADDTLWENNIYFEQAFDEFCEFLSHSRLNPVEVRGVLDEMEIANAKIHGYGSVNFGRNLAQCYRRLAERDFRSGDLETVMGFAARILDRPMQVMNGVAETLEYLSLRHDLTLFTKGNPEEQKLKLDRSGLGIYFGHAAVVKEKDAQAYRGLVEERNLNPASAWMIGNSPKSDINPALRAGLNAVFIPHPHTWRLEHEEVEDGGERLLVLENFGELQEHF
ncbi:MAG: HAD family hydrolase [Bryobacteraceae bacterium]